MDVKNQELEGSIFVYLAVCACTTQASSFHVACALLGVSEYFEALQRLRHEGRAFDSSGAVPGPCCICPEAGLAVSH